VKRTIALVLLTCAGWGLAGCGGGSSEVKCKAAIQAQWNIALGSGPLPSAPATEPAACRGLSNDVVDRMATEVMNAPVES
jgi:hypothetical protein